MASMAGVSATGDGYMNATPINPAEDTETCEMGASSYLES
jgi:hypothetical protein